IAALGALLLLSACNSKLEVVTVGSSTIPAASKDLTNYSYLDGDTISVVLKDPKVETRVLVTYGNLKNLGIVIPQDAFDDELTLTAKYESDAIFDLTLPAAVAKLL